MFYTYDFRAILEECLKGVVLCSSHNILNYIIIYCNIVQFLCRIYVYKHIDTLFSSSVDLCIELSKHSFTSFLHLLYDYCIFPSFVHSVLPSIR